MKVLSLVIVVVTGGVVAEDDPCNNGGPFYISLQCSILPRSTYRCSLLSRDDGSVENAYAPYQVYAVDYKLR